MSKYEYLVEAFKATDEKRIQEKLNTLGAEGWELLSIETTNTFVRIVLKREVGGLI